MRFIDTSGLIVSFPDLLMPGHLRWGCRTPSAQDISVPSSLPELDGPLEHPRVFTIPGLLGAPAGRAGREEMEK